MKYKGSEARRGGGAQTARNSRQSRSIPSFDCLQNLEKRVSLQLEIFWFLYFPVVTIRLEMSSRCLNSEPNPGISSKMKQKSKYLKLQRYSFFKILQAVKGWYGPALAWISRSLSTPTPARLRSYFPHTVASTSELTRLWHHKELQKWLLGVPQGHTGAYHTQNRCFAQQNQSIWHLVNLTFLET